MSATERPTSRQHVLIVDDDPVFRLLYATVLESNGFDVVAVSDGDVALRYFAEQTVDLVLLDSIMPGRSGIEVLEEMRVLSSFVPVALVTGLDDTADRVSGLDCGADDYITKPVEPSELVARVQALLRGRKAAVDSVVPPAEVDDALRCEIDELILRKRFRPVYQPIVRLSDRRVVAHEALTRFDDGARPDLRFTEAHGVGLAQRLELATLTAALEAASALPAGLSLHLNVSPDLLCESVLADLLGTSDRPVVLELTEHQPVDDYDTVREHLRLLGDDVRLAVDDAGAGYASMTHVLALGPSEVKLDRSWVSGVDHDVARQALVSGLVAFATATSTQLVAEGIENEAEAAMLTELGVDHGQGFHLGRPADATPLAG